jgi:hypothetical protein
MSRDCAPLDAERLAEIVSLIRHIPNGDQDTRMSLAAAIRDLLAERKRREQLLREALPWMEGNRGTIERTDIAAGIRTELG